MDSTRVAEVWRPVVGFEQHYSVSSIGRVRREYPASSTFVGRIITPFTTRKGYTRITLYVNGKRHDPLAHRVVADAFCPRPDGCDQVNHKNGIKHDNRAANLEWVTPSQNMRHAFRNGLKEPPVVVGERHGQSKLNQYQVRIMRRAAALGLTHTYLARVFGVTRESVRDIVARKYWKHV